MKNEHLKLWYKNPALTWEEALPIGNGTLGGMVFGRVNSEVIQLNEDSVWYGGPSDRNNPSALDNLEKIRQLIFDGKVVEAQNLATLALSGIPETQRHYEPLGNLSLFFTYENGEVINYKRELDISESIIKVAYEINDVKYKREVFTSYPHHVMVIKLMADKEKAINFYTQLSRGNIRHHDEHVTAKKSRYGGGFNAFLEKSCAVGEDGSWIQGNCGGKNAVSFGSLIKIVSNDGNIKTIGNSVIVEDASEVVIYLSSATDFRFENFEKVCTERINNAIAIGYDKLKAEHISDYKALFDRVEIDVCSEDKKNEVLPTDERMKLVNEGEVDFGIINLMYQYGRYLLISSSRKGALPANLQGIWNKDMMPSWGSKFTININTEMNYWPAEVCNLSECHAPLFDLIERMRVNGRVTAQKMYGCRGFVAHHNTDIWADTAPQDVYLSSTYWVMGASWLCLHLWEHYEFTKDLEFLKRAYETMKEASIFFVDFLVEDKDGHLVVCPTTSPENDFILENGEIGSLCRSATMDNQILYELFTACIKSAEILGVDEEYCQILSDILKKIGKNKVGKHGQIMEWSEDYDEVEPGHRHISQLFALHPGKQISVRKTPELAKAAEKTLERRLMFGGGHTGWSRAWIINMWARLENAEEAYKNGLALLRTTTLPNLLDNHPPFQIDGNFGYTAGVTEMLLHSHNDEISILPALPSEWKKGYIKGVKARGGYTVDICWENNEPTKVVLYSDICNLAKIRYKDVEKTINLNIGEPNIVLF